MLEEFINLGAGNVKYRAEYQKHAGIMDKLWRAKAIESLSCTRAMKRSRWRREDKVSMAMCCIGSISQGITA